MTPIAKAASAAQVAHNKGATWEDIVRAALSAIREPDDAMLLSARRITDDDAYEALTAMVDTVVEGES